MLREGVLDASTLAQVCKALTEIVEDVEIKRAEDIYKSAMAGGSQSPTVCTAEHVSRVVGRSSATRDPGRDDMSDHRPFFSCPLICQAAARS